MLHDDIAILTIEQPLRFDAYIHPICLATPHSSLLQAGDELISIGWGRISTRSGTNINARTLQQVKLPYVPSSDPDCSEIFRPICISNIDTHYWEQVGIASKTIDCGWNSTWPDIYINIPYYYDWIMATIKRSA